MRFTGRYTVFRGVSVHFHSALRTLLQLPLVVIRIGSTVVWLADKINYGHNNAEPDTLGRLFGA